MLLIFAATTLFGLTSAVHTGFDTTTKLAYANMLCMRLNGYDFFIGRVWNDAGKYDKDGVSNIKFAHESGYHRIDGYIFPCAKTNCAHASNQIEAAINRLRADSANVTTLWIDVERASWSDNLEANQKFIQEMAAKGDAMGQPMGVYSSRFNWKEVVGLNFTGLSKYPLWWANYNKHQDMSGFQAFGGWKKPTLHQYK